MDNKFQKIFTIHFPERRVYIEHTFDKLEERMERIKDNRDHKLYKMLREYPNPEIRFECYKDENCKSEILVSLKYLNFKLLN